MILRDGNGARADAGTCDAGGFRSAEYMEQIRNFTVRSESIPSVMTTRAMFSLSGVKHACHTGHAALDLCRAIQNITT